MIRVYLDMDGVLADFDKRAMEILGVVPRDFEGQQGAQALWDKLDERDDFFSSLAPMPDCFDLVEGVKKLGFHPTILTGTPKRNTLRAATQKREWVARNLGKEYEVITCPSKDKCLHMEKVGDVLIDDWEKWQSRWEDRGGRFILHTSAKDSLNRLKQYKDHAHEDWIFENHDYDWIFE